MDEVIVETGQAVKNEIVVRRLGIRKAATLLLLMGEQISTEIFKRLSEKEVTQISRVLSRLGALDEQLSEDVITEAHQQLVGGRIHLRGDLDYAQRLLESAYGADGAQSVMEELTPDDASIHPGLKSLRKAEPKRLAKAISEEHPQAIAVVLATLDPEAAAKTVSLLPDELRGEVCVRLAGLEKLSQPVRDQVADIVAARLGGGDEKTDQSGGPRRVAEMFNRMDRDAGMETLELIEQENPELALAIRNLMFVFNDILLLGDADIRKLIQQVDKKILVKALKGAIQELKDHFFRNMSQRAVEMLQEDIEALGPMRKSDVEVAQQEVVNLIRQMESNGEISLGSGGGDEYVA